MKWNLSPLAPAPLIRREAHSVLFRPSSLHFSLLSWFPFFLLSFLKIPLCVYNFIHKHNFNNCINVIILYTGFFVPYFLSLSHLFSSHYLPSPASHTPHPNPKYVYIKIYVCIHMHIHRQSHNSFNFKINI